MAAQRRSMSADGFAAHQPPAKLHLADVAIGDVVFVAARRPVEGIGSDSVGAFRRERVGAKRVAELVHLKAPRRPDEAIPSRSVDALETRPRMPLPRALARAPGGTRPGERLK